VIAMQDGNVMGKGNVGLGQPHDERMSIDPDMRRVRCRSHSLSNIESG